MRIAGRLAITIYFIRYSIERIDVQHDWIYFSTWCKITEKTTQRKTWLLIWNHMPRVETFTLINPLHTDDVWNLFFATTTKKRQAQVAFYLDLAICLFFRKKCRKYSFFPSQIKFTEWTWFCVMFAVYCYSHLSRKQMYSPDFF